MDIKELLTYAVERKASDLHLCTGLLPMIRVDGDLFPIENTTALQDVEMISMLESVLPATCIAQMKTQFEVDCAVEIPNLARFRVNVFETFSGWSAVFRIIPARVLSLEDLNMPDIFRRLCELPKGLVLVTGPTGTGKSTTLAAMIDHINSTVPEHILTIEDPIEFVHTSKKCLVRQREVHQHTASFSDALRAALREDPDVILVGELRDLETIRLALTAAETGHLVLATLHTSSAAETIHRIIDVFPGDDKALVRSMLSNTLQAVIAQVLMRKKGGIGRVAAQEIMVCNPAIRNLIREDKIPQIYTVIQTGKSLGMQTLEQNIQQLIANGVIDK